MTSLHDLMNRTPGLPCRLDPDPFFSDFALDRRYAARQCGTCPLLLACRLYALESGQRWGVWGGVDMTAVPTYCGTERGYRMHVRDGEAACEPCMDAHAALVEKRRREQLAQEHAAGGTVRGYEVHRRLGEPACAACLAAVREQSAQSRRARAQRGRGRACSASSGSGSAVVLPSPQTGAQPLPIAS
ncbi:WhiB family transcriptional regulator [Streptomyces albogriseolus]|uniref:WhiB family transcriptional regulator n=1 Tax=Streptomyces albogriseolus TaxID=1887 RepID=UPI00367F3097